MSVLSIPGRNPTFNPTKQIKIDYQTLHEPLNKEFLALPYAERARIAQASVMNHIMYSKLFIRCEKHGVSAVTWECRHCHEQDPVHPVGMILTPYRYYLCNDCFKLYQLEKFNFWKELQTYCWHCIMDEWNRIKEINPKLNRDWLNKPHRGLF